MRETPPHFHLFSFLLYTEARSSQSEKAWVDSKYSSVFQRILIEFPVEMLEPILGQKEQRIIFFLSKTYTHFIYILLFLF